MLSSSAIIEHTANRAAEVSAVRETPEAIFFESLPVVATLNARREMRARLAETAQRREQLPVPFPPAVGDVMQFAPTDGLGMADLAGTVRVARLPLTEQPTLYRVVCLNGGARNGETFDAYAEELSR